MPRPKQAGTIYRLGRVSGRDEWYITWSEDRRSRRKSTGTKDSFEAQRELERFVAEQARPPRGEEGIDRILACYLTFKERQFQDEQRKRECYESLEGALKPVFRAFGNLRVRDISAELVREFCRAERALGKKNGSIRKYLGTFRAALNLCKKEGIYSGEIPGFDLPPSDPPRREFLTEEDFRRFMQTEAFPHVDLFCILMANTLKRPGAILQLQWSWGVDFDSGILDFQPPEHRETKKRRTPTPMNSTLREALLDAWELATTDFVIEYAGKPLMEMRRAFKTKAQDAGLPWVTPYVLRHTGASLLSMRGVPLADISEMMGSDEATVRKHYRKFHPDYLRTASNTLESLCVGNTEQGPIVSAHQCAQTPREKTTKGGKLPQNENDEIEKTAENSDPRLVGNDGVGSSILLRGTRFSADHSESENRVSAHTCALTPFSRLKRLEVGPKNDRSSSFWKRVPWNE